MRTKTVRLAFGDEQLGESTQPERDFDRIEIVDLVTDSQGHFRPARYDGVMGIETAENPAALAKVLSMSTVAAADGNRPGQ
ncbi:hypothetical protein [Pseudomonas sp. CFII68]|uniref:hypothetical protein n=1 Tax=Pseudomonas sp. CFII68 TaxID=911243 RepID=UPI0021098B64|nr:hypothetical protein [Pseudomonas sp. CFII68]